MFLPKSRWLFLSLYLSLCGGVYCDIAFVSNLSFFCVPRDAFKKSFIFAQSIAICLSNFIAGSRDFVCVAHSLSRAHSAVKTLCSFGFFEKMFSRAREDLALTESPRPDINSRQRFFNKGSLKGDIYSKSDVQMKRRYRIVNMYIHQSTDFPCLGNSVQNSRTSGHQSSQKERSLRTPSSRAAV